MKEYRSPDGLHRHKCPECGAVWEHPDSLMWDCRITEDEFRRLRHCPNCNHYKSRIPGGTTDKYSGPEPPSATHRAKSST